MDNMFLLIKLNNGTEGVLSEFNNSIKDFFLEREFEGNYYDDTLIYKKHDKNIIIEFKKLDNTNNYLYNVFYYKTFVKRNFLKDIFLSDLVIDSKILFDTGSNRLLNEYHCEISKLENLMKYYLACRIANIQGSKVFNIVNNFKVKDYIGENNGKMITSLQRVNLNDIFTYIKSNPLGGDEINILRALADRNSETEDNSDDIDVIRSFIETNIFSGLYNILVECGIFENVNEWRNVISHNACIENQTFIELGNKIKEITEKISEVCIKMHNEKDLVKDPKTMPNISVMLSSKQSKESILLRLLEVLNSNYNNTLISEFINSNNVENIEDRIVFNCSKLKLIIVNIEGELDTNTDSEYKTYKVFVYFHDKLAEEHMHLTEKIYGLFDNIAYEYIVLYDKISDSLCDGLYTNINIVENLVRLYIKISQALLIGENKGKKNKNKLSKANMRLALDLNALKINIDDSKIDLVNNDLYELDFIKLLDKLSNPLNDIKYNELVENKKYKDLEEFNKSIAQLVAIDDNIASITDKWKELYRIRTMVAHNYILKYNSFLEYKELYLEAQEEIEKAIYKLLTDNVNDFNLNYKKETEDTTLLIRDSMIRSKLEFVRNEVEQFSCYIPSHSIWKVINSVFKLGLNEDAIFLTGKLVDVLSEKDIDNLSTKDIEERLGTVIQYYKCNINDKSKNYRILEDAISDLLSEIAKVNMGSQDN